MLKRAFGTATGIKLIFGCLFISFLFFTAFVYTSEVPETVSPAEQELALKGKHLWQQNNCSACHQLYGLGGYLGPDVTNVMSAKGKGELYVRAILQHGTATMPDFKLKPDEIQALVVFLKDADKSGKADRSHFRTDPYGQIHQTNTSQP